LFYAEGYHGKGKAVFVDLRGIFGVRIGNGKLNGKRDIRGKDRETVSLKEVVL